ncbi:MAG: 4Fe-4S dicluster domain-containing protein [Nitrospinae bacterium]|nr:4Fe-4S dicluster domain-containing protein [Nitrospinota bacterium]
MTEFDRRTLLKFGAAAVVGSALGPGITLFQAFARDGEKRGPSKIRWGLVIDANKCTADCTACTNACRTENNVPLFGDPRYDGHWIRKVTVTPKTEGAVGRSLPLLCNHCEQPPCQHVCPVAATFTRDDGIVMIDKHRCIGCRYCMIACPYKARTFVFKNTEKWTNPDVPKRGKGVVEKCTFCAHRIDKGQIPACVEACNKEGEKAMIFGNLNDPNSEIVQYIRANTPKGIREDLGLEPKVFYKGI